MNLKRIITLAILAIAIFKCTTWCNRTETEKIFSYGDNLKDAIEDFEDTREDFSQEVVKSVNNASKDLSVNDPNLQEVAIDWETQWKSIQSDFKTLEADFSAVGQSSNEYFDQLQELCSGIRDIKIRASEINKNAELKQKWTSAFVEASKNIKQIRQVMTEGNNFHRVLVASSVRQKIEANITELNAIASRAKAIMAELEQVTIEGKNLIS